ncbi:MAG: trimeric intracellular cation channel family protein [Clostridiales bacterium]|nr:trimeric intracellular cation channel family protein [Clostridiales bacterium]
MNDPFLPVECLGIVAFAVSGALLAIRKGMDLFGVNVLGLFTAVGGGLLRDLMLGITPPQMLRDPTFALIAIATSTVLFALLYFYRRDPSPKAKALYRQFLLYTDAVGLGIFTASGVETAMRAYPEGSPFLMLFVALMTGTGGGILRDIMAGETPGVLVRHIYAMAALSGACVYLLLYGALTGVEATLVCAAVVVAIRGLASHFRWNFPSIRPPKPPEGQQPL